MERIVTKEEFYRVIGPQDATMTFGPLACRFRLRYGRELGRIEYEKTITGNKPIKYILY